MAGKEKEAMEITPEEYHLLKIYHLLCSSFFSDIVSDISQNWGKME